MKDKPTIYDVAAHAEVSTSTVSRVLNCSDKVSPETRERVKEAIKRLDYRPNQVAQRLGLSRRTSSEKPTAASEAPPEAPGAQRSDEMPLVRVHFEGDWTPSERAYIRRAIAEAEATGGGTGTDEIWICTLLQVAGQCVYLASPLTGDERPVKGDTVPELARQLSIAPS